MKPTYKNAVWLALFAVLMVISHAGSATSLVKVVKQIKPSVVGVGIYDPLGSPRANLMGTGFVVGDGTIIATNYHVVERDLSDESQEKRVIFVGSGNNPKTLEAETIATDPVHDLALLRISEKLTPVTLGNEEQTLEDGTEVAFTGYPIGAVLGLYAATHQGIIAAFTPVVTPSLNANQLSIEMMKRLRDPYFIYQLDATAYPGNSGSPVYDVEQGTVIGVINKVFVKRTKEAALSDPSGITYAIPVSYLHDLLGQIK